MSLTIPDNWVVIRIKDKSIATGYIDRVLAGWHGGYLYGDSWKINSGIKKSTEFKHFWKFYGYSGSVYKCYKNNQGFSSITSSIYESIKGRLPPTTTIEVLSLEGSK